MTPAWQSLLQQTPPSPIASGSPAQLPASGYMRDDDTTQRAATRWPYMLGSDARASRGNYGYNSSPALTPTGVSLAAHVVATAPGAPHLNDGRPAGNCNKSQPDDENNICLRELAEDVALEARSSHLGGLETADIPTAAEDMAPEATVDMAPTVGTIRADTKQQAAGTAGPTDTIGTNPGAAVRLLITRQRHQRR